jgi:hypothetical protein
MKSPSHFYEFTLKEAGRVVAIPLLTLTVFPLAMHLGAVTKLLPPPRPALDVDRTILIHQATASRTRHDAKVLLIGDSSCLMNVAADQLRRSLPQPSLTLNLGTLSYLDLHAFSTILSNYVMANPERPRLVVLLMHPEALRRPGPTDYHVESLEHFYAGLDHCGPGVSRPLCALGVEIFRGRILSRGVPQPLPGAFGREYGFTHDLWEYLSAHQGSALDPGRFDPAAASGNLEYRLAPAVERGSRAFRAAVPAATRLMVGITPVPESLAQEGYEPLQQQMLATWGDWLSADALLTELPATVPDHLFASATHLNEPGVRLYTEQLSASIRAREAW